MFQITGQEIICQDQQCEDGTDFPADGAHVGCPGLAVQTDQLLGGQVCEKQRTGDDNTGKTAAGQEITFSRVEIIFFCLET